MTFIVASSKGSPGPHDRRRPRTQCIKITSFGKRCRRFAVGQTKLCKGHANQAAAEAAGEPTAGQLATPPDPTVGDMTTGGIVTSVQKRGLAKFVINEQARQALKRLGQPDPSTDPRRTLLEAVASAHNQRLVWEQMLAEVPEADWAMLGVTPIPGSSLSATGARIEAIQKFLGEATKSAARISKLAIDAGIEERLVRLAEEQSAMIADTVKAGIMAAFAVFIRELRLSKADQDRVLGLALGDAATHLRQLEAGITGAQPPVDPRATAAPSTARNVTPQET